MRSPLVDMSVINRVVFKSPLGSEVKGTSILSSLSRLFFCVFWYFPRTHYHNFKERAMVPQKWLFTKKCCMKNVIILAAAISLMVGNVMASLPVVVCCSALDTNGVIQKWECRTKYLTTGGYPTCGGWHLVNNVRTCRTDSLPVRKCCYDIDNDE